MSFDISRNAAELGEGYPLYRAQGDLSASAQVFASQGGATNISPEATVSGFQAPAGGDLLSGLLGKPLNTIILALIVLGIILYLSRRKGVSLP